LQVLEYARQLARAREVSAEDSVGAARERLEDLQADRLRGLGHTFLVARSERDGTRVGWVWLSPPPFLGPGHERTRWLSQLTVEESCRRQGWGRAILTALERFERERGAREIWLRVFDWNVVARRLYESHGYELANQFATDAHLRKRIGTSATTRT
jgi:ribosomal protein S18 acetylase RimI-like enzyme